jgi:oligoribonuclease NrnB/cAMP/cGMP phosphodiesterase (DHH superfamily)
MQPEIDLIIYHGNCADGWCAAYVAKRRWPKAELLPAFYGEDCPFNAVAGKHVLVVDFSWVRGLVRRLRSEAKSLLILDHHVTAKAELVGEPYCVFDMERSGAQLAWDVCFPGEARPWQVDCVADRDLWQWKLPHSREVNAFLSAQPPDTTVWNELWQMDLQQVLVGGVAILRHVDRYVEQVTAQHQDGLFAGHLIAVVNAAYPNISEVGHALCRQHPLFMGWFERVDGKMQFSLRSVGDLDVSQIAKDYGGGGHRNAAGFELSITNGRKLLDAVLKRKA